MRRWRAPASTARWSSATTTRRTARASSRPGPARAWIDRAWEITRPHGTGGAYVNFPEDGLDPWAPEYLGGNRERLLELKRRYDPAGVFG